MVLRCWRPFIENCVNTGYGVTSPSHGRFLNGGRIIVYPFLILSLSLNTRAKLTGEQLRRNRPSPCTTVPTIRVIFEDYRPTHHCVQMSVVDVDAPDFMETVTTKLQFNTFLSLPLLSKQWPHFQFFRI